MDEARSSGGFLIFAYCILSDHVHILADGARPPSKVMQYLNGIASRRIIDFLKTHGHTSSLEKLRHETQRRKYSYSLWDHHPNTFLITSEAKFMEKVNYIHLNPVEAGLVAHPLDYRWSSARFWKGVPRQDEPFKVDNDKIVWRQSG